jgi:hypothetical protein
MGRIMRKLNIIAAFVIGVVAVSAGTQTCIARDDAQIRSEMQAVGIEIDRLTRSLAGNDAELKDSAALIEKYVRYAGRIAQIDKNIALVQADIDKQNYESGKVPLLAVIAQYEIDKALLKEFKHRQRDPRTGAWIIVAEEPPGGIEFGLQKLANFDQLQAKVIKEIEPNMASLKALLQLDGERLAELQSRYAALERERAALRPAARTPAEAGPVRQPPAPPPPPAAATPKLQPLDPTNLLGEWNLDDAKTSVRIYASGYTPNGDTLLEGRFGDLDLRDYDPSSPADALLFRKVVRLNPKPGQPPAVEEYAGEIWLKDSAASGRWVPVYLRLTSRRHMVASDLEGRDSFGFTRRN